MKLAMSPEKLCLHMQHHAKRVIYTSVNSKDSNQSVTSCSLGTAFALCLDSTGSIMVSENRTRPVTGTG